MMVLQLSFLNQFSGRVCLAEPLFQGLALGYLKGFGGLYLELSSKLLEVVVGYLDLGEDLGPCQFIDFVSEVVGSSIGLNCELKF